MLNSVQKEFDRRFNTYKDYNFLQKKIAQELIALTQYKPTKIVDLGAGDGEIYKNIDWKIERFYALEFSKNMLQAHPDDQVVQKLNRDFNTQGFLDSVKADFAFSSSALQWSVDLDFTLREISKNLDAIAFAIFSDNTFKTIRDLTHLPTHLRQASEIKSLVQKYFDCQCEIKQYRLDFSSKEELFAYIKKSGVSGGKKQLTYTQTKNLMHNYPHLFLEFEVVFCY